MIKHHAEVRMKNRSWTACRVVIAGVARNLPELVRVQVGPRQSMLKKGMLYDVILRMLHMEETMVRRKARHVIDKLSKPPKDTGIHRIRGRVPLQKQLRSQQEQDVGRVSYKQKTHRGHTII